MTLFFIWIIVIGISCSFNSVSCGDFAVVYFGKGFEKKKKQKDYRLMRCFYLRRRWFEQEPCWCQEEQEVTGDYRRKTTNLI
jgi:hypothetical protein